jgi:hypothetical protein
VLDRTMKADQRRLADGLEDVVQNCAVLANCIVSGYSDVLPMRSFRLLPIWLFMVTIFILIRVVLRISLGELLIVL